jgi:hypothetical protein
LQQQCPTSELMMLDRLQVADLKDEIVSMQSDLNSVLFETQQQQSQEGQVVIKNEPVCQPLNQSHHASMNQNQMSNQHIPTQSQQQRNFISSLHEPSQILKAKQEQKLFDNIKNERIKIEVPEIQKDSRKGYGTVLNNSNVQNSNTTTSKPAAIQKASSKFDKLKNETICNATNQQTQQQQTQISKQSSQQTTKASNEPKDDLDDFDIESEIHSNLIMKKCEPSSSTLSPNASNNNNNSKKIITKVKEKEKEREYSPLSDYLNSVKMELIPSKNNKSNEAIKSETHDGSSYDEWFSIQKELNLHLGDQGATPSTSASSPVSSVGSKRKDFSSGKSIKIQPAKALESELSDIFEQHHTSPKSVEKQLDDLFSSTSKSSDLLGAASPPELSELFQAETASIGEKTVENRLEALFGGPEDENGKSAQQDLVEKRLEQLFQGSVNANDESALDNASFLYKSTDMTYEMIQKQIQVTTRMESSNSNTSNANKRQWNSSNTCDIFSPSNTSIIFPSSPTTSKRACTAASAVSFDNKWIDDSFDFGGDISIPNEATSDDLTKHREWNGNIDSNEAMIGGSQFQMPANDTTNLHQHTNHSMQSQQQQQQQLSIMDQRQDNILDASQIAPMNYDDVDDISRQVQNAIDSILNLQSSETLNYQFDSSFLELNAITSSSPNSPINHQQGHSNSHHNQFPIHQHHHQSEHQMVPNSSFVNQKMSTTPATTPAMPKRKYSRMDDIGDCLIGGSNLDDSPSALSLTGLNDGHADTQDTTSSSASVGEFVNNLLNCDEKSITTS